MTRLGLWIILYAVSVQYGCAPLKTPVVITNESMHGYKYIFITPTNNLTSGSASTYGGEYGIYRITTNKSINPGDVISGNLLKKGFIRVPEIRMEHLDETIVINYGESGRRNRGFGYTIEVTIQFISAKTHQQICSCTAEGQGETEADDIRMAINRCLSAMIPSN